MGYCDGAILNNTIVNNYLNSRVWTGQWPYYFATISMYGGLYHCTGEIRNNIIWGNLDNTDNIDVTDQISEDSTTPTFSCIQDWGEEADVWGNISADPMFICYVQDYRDLDITSLSLHLIAFSSCIDAGSTVTFAIDILGRDRGIDAHPANGGDGSGVDIGAYEYIADALLVTDQILEVQQFQPTAGQLALLDANQDGLLDIADVIVWVLMNTPLGGI